MTSPCGSSPRSAALILWLLLPTTASAATIRVPQDRSTLTAAVRSARPGDEIVLAAGRYAPRHGERFPIELAGKSLRIRGAGPDRTTLDAEGRSRHFVVRDPDRSRIQDLRLVGGRAPDGGGAILVEGGEPAVVRVAFAYDESAAGGDAIQVSGGRPRIANCLFTENGGRGPTVWIVGGAPRVVRCTLWENGGPSLGIRGTTVPLVERCVIGRPGTLGGPRLGVRIVAWGDATSPTFSSNVFLDCDDGVVRVEGEAGPTLAVALESARRARGLRSTAGALRDPERGDYRLARGLGDDADAGAYGGDEALPAPSVAADGPMAADSTVAAPLLHPSVPNPFAPRTTIHFQVPEASVVDLGIYNVLGQRVRTLPAGDLPGGEHSQEWDGRDDRGEDLPPGIYFVRITIGSASESQRLVLVR